jgi:microcystin-dependent protein
MSIAKEVTYVDGVTPVSAAWLNLVQEFLAGYVSPNFKVELNSATSVRVPAGNDHDSVGIAIEGEFRRRDTNATVTVSGGAGLKNIYATADSADNLFALEMSAGAASAAKARLVAIVDWSGTAISEIINTYPLLPQVQGEIPIGASFQWWTDTAPPGFLILDGGPVSRSTYADLFALWGTTFGAGNGTTTFGIPDTRQKFILGKAASGTGATVGDTGGAIDHTHTGPSHTHTGPNHAHSGPSHTHTGPSHTHAISGTTSTTGNHQHATPSTEGAAEVVNQGLGFQTGFTEHIHDISGGNMTLAAGNHNHTFSDTSSASGTGATGAGGTGQTGNAGTGATGAGGTGLTGTANPPFITAVNIVRAL